MLKPLGIKNYGSIPHLPGSRLGPGDHSIHAGQDTILCVKPRDRHDRVIVQEKLDGSNVGVARIDGQLFALGRAGYPAQSSKYEQHQLFAAWVRENAERFMAALRDDERLVGEWLAQAHGTRYDLAGREPFVAFDLMRQTSRVPYAVLVERLTHRSVQPAFSMPYVLSDGPAASIEHALSTLGDHGFYGAIDKAEGCVWRVERKGRVDFLAKYVRPEKQDGVYLPEISGGDAVWNWRPKNPKGAQ